MKRFVVLLLIAAPAFAQHTPIPYATLTPNPAPTATPTDAQQVALTCPLLCSDTDTVGGMATRTSPWANARAWGATGDGFHDDTAALQAALSGASTVLLPCGTYKITSALVMNGAGKSLVGDASGCSILRTYSDIVMLQVGTYSYTGSNDWNWSTSPTLYNTVAHLHFIQTANTHTSGIGIDMRGANFGHFEELHFQGLPWGMVVRPISSFNIVRDVSVDDMLIVSGTTALYPIQGAVRVQGDGFNAGYASQGNIYSDITATNVQTSSVYMTGAAFGDATVPSVFSYTAPMRAGSHLWLDSTGARYKASHINIGPVDVDGLYTWGLFTNGAQYLQLDGAVFASDCTAGGPVAWTNGSGHISYAYISNCGVSQGATQAVIP